MTAIHQFLPTFEPGAIGNHAVQVQKALQEQGFESEIFAEYVRGAFEGTAHIHTDYGSRIAANSNDVLMYHMAIGSNVSDFLMQRPERLVVDHHNITPVEFYQPWEPGVTYGMAWGRAQLRDLAQRSTHSIADSEYNRRELEDLKYTDTTVVPILLDFAAFEHAVDESKLAELSAAKSDGGADLIFVGWVAPHKCQHDIIRAFSLYKRLYDPKARLHLVGRNGSEHYVEACRKLIVELGLQDSAFLTGGVSDGELGAYYRIADALVSMSEHEGVGIPLLESMYHRVPVLAYAAAAVPETVADAGILLPRKTPALVAAAMNRIVNDVELRHAVIERGIGRLDLFTLEENRQRLIESLGPLL